LKSRVENHCCEASLFFYSCPDDFWTLEVDGGDGKWLEGLLTRWLVTVVSRSK
jgi:hypothetical protein